MLFYPALQAVDLLELVAQIYQLAGMVRFAVQQVFTELFCLALPRLLANRHCEREGGVNVIDNPGTVARLLEQMEDQLPIPAFPTKDVVRILRRRGVKANADHALSVKRV